MPTKTGKKGKEEKGSKGGQRKGGAQTMVIIQKGGFVGGGREKNCRHWEKKHKKKKKNGNPGPKEEKKNVKFKTNPINKVPKGKKVLKREKMASKEKPKKKKKGGQHCVPGRSTSKISKVAWSVGWLRRLKQLCRLGKRDILRKGKKTRALGWVFQCV